MKLAVFHYHLRPGGVTGVVTEACIALGRYGRLIEDVVLVCGSDENTDSVLARIRAAAPALPVSVRIHPELRYASDQNGTSPAALEARIAGLLRAEYLSPDVVWWVHNYHLGKNPPFTAALVSVLQTEPAQRAVLHIHDFPECGRLENLAELRSHLQGTVYPTAPNIAYATINYRDRSLLIEAGIPRDRVFALPNPVEPPDTRSRGAAGAVRGCAPDGAPPRQEVLERLRDAFGDRFPFVDPDAPLVLYPVRAIRRKNVFEAGFLARLLGTDLGHTPNLIVTLPGTSPLEKPYSDMVEAAFEAGVLPGLAGVGADLDKAGLGFSDLMSAADLVVSTSVQEGFGYAFFEAPGRGVPIAARYLDVLDGLGHLFTPYPHAFYRELRVPFESPSIDSIRALLRIRYDEQLERSTASMPAPVRKQLESEVEDMLAAPTIDFSFLMPQIQYAYARDLADEGFANEVRALNFEVLGPMIRVLHGTRSLARPADLIREELGYERYAARVVELIESLSRRVPQGTTETVGNAAPRSSAEDEQDPIQRRLIDAFAHKEYVRLLYGPVGE